MQNREMPAEIPAFKVEPGMALLDAVVGAGLAPSRREARRLFEQGAVSIDGEVARIEAEARAGAVVQVGKRRWLRLEEA